LFERTCEFSGMQFTKHFIEFVFVETNEVVCSNSNVILMRQTCGHRSSRVAGSKRRALAFYFSVQIGHMFSLSICRGKSDLGVCMTSVLAKRMRPHNVEFRFQNVFSRRTRGFWDGKITPSERCSSRTRATPSVFGCSNQPKGGVTQY